MRLLISPELGEPAEVWKAWIAQLWRMPQVDRSVQYALQRAQRILDEMRSAVADKLAFTRRISARLEDWIFATLCLDTANYSGLFPVHNVATYKTQSGFKSPKR